MQLALKDLWLPTGLLLGFQVTFLKWRIEEENKVGSGGSIPWLTPSDYIGLIGMLSFVAGTILLPILDILDAGQATYFFGLGTLLFLGQVVGLIGHYQMFNRTRTRKPEFFPMQEKVALGITAVFLVIYVSAPLRGALFAPP